MAYQKRSRRTYGTGTVSKNRAIGRYTVIWTDADGKKKTCSRFPLTPAGKKDAEDFLMEINSAKADGVKVSNEETLGKWIKIKMDSDTNIRQSTMQSRAYHALRIIRFAPELVETPIAQIEPGMIQRMYRKMQDGGLAASTIKRIHSLLCGVFKKAYAGRVIRYNIMNEVITPRQKKNEIEIFTWRETAKIFWFLQNQPKQCARMTHDYVLFFRILHGTGMRIGEALALKWGDINITKREIHVHSTISGYNGGIIEEPKTQAGNRLIPILSDKTLALLAKAREEHGPDEWFLQSSTGTRVPYSNLFHEWSVIRKATGINKNLHVWRHSFATRMLAEGYPITEIARIMGHSSQTITLEMYGHSIPSFNSQMITMYREKRKKHN